MANTMTGRSGTPGQKGEMGDKGDKGQTGERGLPGTKGERGDSMTGAKGDRVSNDFMKFFFIYFSRSLLISFPKMFSFNLHTKAKSLILKEEKKFFYEYVLWCAEICQIKVQTLVELKHSQARSLKNCVNLCLKKNGKNLI